MSIDAAVQEALQPLRDRLDQLERRVAVAENNLKRPVYDAKQLMDELGFGQHDAYNVLRAYGTLINGRRRISAVELMRVYSRENEEDSDFSARSRAYPAMESASAVN